MKREEIQAEIKLALEKLEECETNLKAKNEDKALHALASAESRLRRLHETCR